MIKLLVVDDHTIFRSGLSRLLLDEPDMRVAAEARNGSRRCSSSACGLSASYIGAEMLISVKTVSTHRTHILEKIGVSSTAELVLYAVRQGLIH